MTKRMQRRSKTLKTNCRTLFAASREALQPIDVIHLTRQNSNEEVFKPYMVTTNENVSDDWYSPRFLFTAREALQPICVFKIANQPTKEYEECFVPFLFKKWQENYDNGPLFWKI